MKRWISALLACALLTASTGALASDRLIRDTLHGYSHIINTHVNTESTTGTTARSLTLDVGDYSIVSPVHSVNTNYLSYDLSEVESTDPDVVEAGFYRQSDGRLGLRLRGKAPGSAVVTATYSTYRTRAGLNYEDKRASATFTQVLNVTVEEKGSVDVRLNVSGAGYNAVRGVSLRMSAPEPVARSVGPDREVAEVSGFLTDPDAPDAAAEALESVRGLTDLLADAWRVARDARTAGLTEQAVPAAWPEQLTLTATVVNNSAEAVTGLRVLAEGDRNISFCGDGGPWGAPSLLYRDDTLQPGESRTFSASLCPRFVDEVLSADGAPVSAYAAGIRVVCEYGEGENARAVSRELDLPVYTEVTEEQLTRYMAGGGAGASRQVDRERTRQVFAFTGPVELTVTGGSGAGEAVICGDGDVFSDGALSAFGLGGTLFAVVPVEALYDYELTVRATGAGGMDAVTYAWSGEGGARFRTYDAVPLSGDDAFSLLLSPEDAAELCREDAVGALTPLAADDTVDQADLVAALAGRGLSEDEAKALAALMLKGLSPDALLNGALDREALCALIVEEAGLFFDLEPSQDPAVTLERLGLSPDAAGEGPVTVAEALALTDGLLERLGLASGQSAWQMAPLETWPGGNRPEDLAVGETGLCEAFGLDEGLEPESALTAGQAAALADRALEYAALAMDRNALVRRIGDAYENSLGWYDDFANLCLYAMSPVKPAQTLLGDAILWFPTADGHQALYSSLSYLAAATMAYASVVTGNDEAYAAVRSGEADRQLAACEAMGGAFTGPDGTACRWVPFCLMDGDEKIKQDAVYLAVVEIDAGAASDYVVAHDVNEYSGDYTAKYFLIADQTLVAAFLSACAPLVPPEEPEKLYEELAAGSKGDEVSALQARLFKLGFLESEPDGSYGEKTAAAVSAFQEQNGLEPTGTADARTQALLYESQRVLPIFKDWLARHATDVTTAEALAPREANAGAEALRRAIAGEGLLHALENRPQSTGSRRASTYTEVPEALAERCGGFPESLSDLEARYGVSELAAVYGQWAPASIAAELQYVGSVERPRLDWSYSSGTFDAITADGEGATLKVTCREKGDVMKLTVDGDFDPDATTYCSFALEFTSGGRRRAIEGDASDAAVVAEEAFDAGGYTDCRYAVECHGSYTLVRLTATGSDGAEHGWAATYDASGRLVDRHGG